MMQTLVLVTDTNIWIDVENGNVLKEVFQLPYQFVIPDLAIQELRAERWATLQALGLQAVELGPEQVAELWELNQLYRPRLSTVDLAAYLAAKMIGATLLSGDRRLSELAREAGIEVHGVLWMLDELVHYRSAAPGKAAMALKRMLDLGARLPEDECTRRLDGWSHDMTKGGE